MDRAFRCALVLMLSITAGVGPTDAAGPEAGRTDYSDPRILRKTDLSWLTLTDRARGQWRMTAHPTNPQWRFIEAVNAGATQRPARRLVVIVPKRSNSYVLALSELLAVLAENDIEAELTVINFGKIDIVGLEALAYARLWHAELVFSTGSESAQLVTEHFRGDPIPVVTAINKDPVLLGQVRDYQSGSGTNIAYTSLNVPLDVQMNYLLDLKPELKVVGLLYNSNHEQVMATEVLPSRKVFRDNGIKVVDIAVSGRDSAPLELARRMPVALEEMRNFDPLLRDSLLWVTSSTAVFAHIEVVNEYSQNVPVLGSIPNVVAEGTASAVMAIGIDRRNNAHLAALYAVDILTRGVEPGVLPVGIVNPPDVSINFQIAKRIGLQIPFQFFENASFIYDYGGAPARAFGQRVSALDGR